ncbi:hypothetical protein PanWU01x14_339090 [Parasponia andersonii]|uniref:Uncharacterized protein n=1 Tax=Parasponia andersonii TaxID=3476 RepID=A0A2P5AEY8_PARAD|nr:hypothetical protein PanWU01x14_339090 [Parasponia andersonii]
MVTTGMITGGLSFLNLSRQKMRTHFKLFKIIGQSGKILSKLDKAYERPRDAQCLDNIRKLEKEWDKLLWLQEEY